MIKPWYNHLKDVWYGIKTWLTDKENPYNIQTLLASLVTAFFAVTAAYIAILDVPFSNMPAFVDSVNLLVFAGAVFGATAVLVLLCRFVGTQRVLPPVLLAAVTAFCVCLQETGDRDIWTCVGIALFLYLVCVWLWRRFDTPFSSLKCSFGFVRIAVFVLFCVFVVGLSYMGYARYYSFTYDAFDFGIFAQMFGYMKETGLPLTTVERNVELSHFAVHFSPFFYVILPVYCLFPTPVCLCVMQTLFVAAGVFAVYGIVRHFDFTPKQTLACCMVYLLYPAFSFGLFYDFHENKFLTVCILFTVYFMLRRKFLPFYISAILLCTVKEDAAIYLVAIALFMLAHEKLTKHGLITLALALVYFVFALEMVAWFSSSQSLEFGYRYDNFALDGDVGIGDIIKVLVVNFAYAFKQMFQADKVQFLLWLFVPVLCTPFMTKKVSVLLLLTPMVLVNLLTSWLYQYDIDYQYTYGSGALIIAAMLVVLHRMDARKRNALLATAGAICVAVTVPRVIIRMDSYISSYQDNREVFHDSEKFLQENLEREAVIGASSSIVTTLHNYPNLYLDPHNDWDVSDKIAYYAAKLEEKDAIAIMENRGFERIKDNGYVAIYRNGSYVDS